VTFGITSADGSPFILTVGELKTALTEFPDDAKILTKHFDAFAMIGTVSLELPWGEGSPEFLLFHLTYPRLTEELPPPGDSPPVDQG
jgi:hypothetical protein